MYTLWLSKHQVTMVMCDRGGQETSHDCSECMRLFSEICLLLPVSHMAQRRTYNLFLSHHHMLTAQYDPHITSSATMDTGCSERATCVLWGVEYSVLYALVLQWLFLSHSSVEVTQSLVPLVQRLPPSPTSSLLSQPFSWWVLPLSQLPANKLARWLYSLCQLPANKLAILLFVLVTRKHAGHSSLCLSHPQTCWPLLSLSQSPANVLATPLSVSVTSKQAGHSSLCLSYQQAGSNPKTEQSLMDCMFTLVCIMTSISLAASTSYIGYSNSGCICTNVTFSVQFTSSLRLFMVLNMCTQ